MKFRQKRGRYKAEFDFQDTELVYSFGDDRDRQGSSMPYDRIGTQWKYYTRHSNASYKYAIYLCVLVGFVMAHFGLPHGLENSIKIFLAFSGGGLAFLLIRFFDKDAVVTILTGEPPVRLLNDKQHDEILDEIMRREHAQSRQKNKEIDFAADPAAESQKFFTARYYGLITEAEFTDAMARLTAMKQGRGQQDAGRSGPLSH